MLYKADKTKVFIENILIGFNITESITLWVFF